MNDIARFLDNRMNPLLVRELRQLVRNRFIIVMVNLFIAVMVITCMMTVLFQDATRIEGGGGLLFAWLSFIMSLACFIAVVVYTSTTTASERISGDLMFTSAMRPSSIVFGKAWAGAVLTVLLMSMTAPFVMLAYLLRGLDIEMVGQTFLNIFVSIQVMNALAICLFSNVKTKVQMSVMMILGLFVFMFMIGPAIQLLLMSRFIGGAVTPDWTAYVGFLLTSGALLTLLLTTGSASIAPPTSNRLLPVRVVLTIIYLGSLLLGLYFADPLTGLKPWVYGWLGALSVMCLLVVCERERWSFRIRQTIPKRVVLRILCFPFYSGSPNGLVWVGLLFGGVFLSAFFFRS